MLHIFSENARGRYNPLDNTRNPRLCTLSIHGIRFAVLLSLYSILLILLSFVAGRFSINDRSLPTIPLHTKTKIFHYDPRFGAVPSNASNAIWQSIFPAQGGFFKHPTLAPKRSAFSVFHQLHCLDGIRQAYYTVYSAALSGQKVREDDFPFMASPPHMRHCVDLLRQSLMCKPDTTIEAVNETLNGVTGFGTEHQCWDFAQLLDWTSQWEGYDKDPRAEANELEVPAEHQLHDRHIS